MTSDDAAAVPASQHPASHLAQGPRATAAADLARRARPRVLMVHPLAGRRGPARTLAALASCVARESDVLVVAPRGFLTSSLESASGVKVQPIRLSRSRIVSWAAGSTRIARLVKRGPRPDIIHANGLSAFNLVALTAWWCRTPVFVHFHHHADIEARARVLAWMWPRLGVDVHIAPVSLAAQQRLIAAGLERYLDPILPNPIDHEVGGACARSSHLPVRIGFIGSRSPRKGLHLLVQIAKQLADEGLRWLVFGLDPGDRSPYVRSCRQMVRAAGLEHQIQWSGRVQDPYQAYAQMDVLLVPSLEESWCRVAMEGMSVGLPVVGSNIPGLSELLGLVEGALMFDPDNPEMAATHIRRLIHDPDLRSELGRRGQDVVQRFDVEVIAHDLLSRYERLSSQHAPAVS